MQSETKNAILAQNDRRIFRIIIIISFFSSIKAQTFSLECTWQLALFLLFEQEKRNQAINIIPKNQDFNFTFFFYCANCSLKSCIKLTKKLNIDEETFTKNRSFNNAFFCDENFHIFFPSLSGWPDIFLCVCSLTHLF